MLTRDGPVVPLSRPPGAEMAVVERGTPPICDIDDTDQES